MIRKNLLNCNLIQLKTLTKILFQKYMVSFHPETEVCSFCMCMGLCRIHAYYNRSVIDFFEDSTVYNSVRIPRVVCTGCGHTHAILPDPIIPYSTYSLLFILRVLHLYFSHSRTIEKICERFQIVPAMLYRWKKLFQKHRSEWQGLLNCLEESDSAFLSDLLRLSPYSSFASSFTELTAVSFLQSHKNPSFSKRSKSPPDSVFT